MLIDTHAHLDNAKYKRIRNKILAEAQKEDMKAIINPGIDLKSSINSVKLADEYDIIYAAVGYHPHEARHVADGDLKKIGELAFNKKVVAIGEIGLDYHYEHSPREVQKNIFDRQIKIAKRLKLPIIVHSREAHGDTYEILQRNSKDLNAVLHSYSGSWEMAKKYFDLGFYVSFSGTVTFKNARKVKEVAKKAPIDRILIETDSPYLTPEPNRGKLNSPLYVKYIAEEISSIKNIPTNDLLMSIQKNTLDLFDRINL